MIRRLGLLCVCVALAAAACGGDDSAEHNTLPPVVTTTTTTTIPPTTTTYPESYVVQQGDILSEIAKRFNVSQTVLMELNNITNPDKIRSGQRLKLPPPSTTTTTVATNDTTPDASGDASATSTP